MVVVVCGGCREGRERLSHTLDLGRALPPHPRVEDVPDLRLLRRRQRERVARRHGQTPGSLVAALCGHGGHSLPGVPGWNGGFDAGAVCPSVGNGRMFQSLVGYGEESQKCAGGGVVVQWCNVEARPSMHWSFQLGRQSMSMAQCGGQLQAPLRPSNSHGPPDTIDIIKTLILTHHILTTHRTLSMITTRNTKCPFVYLSTSHTLPFGTNAMQRFYTLDIITPVAIHPPPPEMLPLSILTSGSPQPDHPAPRTAPGPDPGSPSPSCPSCQSCSATGTFPPCSWWRSPPAPGSDCS